jgi:2-polyprenyl-3-methyl-5-hydroxy-6-metoxy-1,4-benzoquinol methylase
MVTMQQSNPVLCPLCQSNLYTVLFPSTLTKKDFNPDVIAKNLTNTLDNYKKHSRIVRCLVCQLVYTNPMENITSLLKGYKDVVDTEYIITEKYRKVVLLEHLEKIQEYKKNGRMLDVGCFAGFFLEVAKKSGWKTYGIEPSIWASEIAKKRKIKIISKSIEAAKFTHRFEVITMWDVIEHVKDPYEVLKKCYDALEKDGIIAIGTPDISSVVATILGKNNPYLVRMHLLFFSPKTLETMLENIGFTVIKKYKYGRIFPLSYIFDRIKINHPLYKLCKRYISAIGFISNLPIRLNLGDSFAIIARK